MLSQIEKTQLYKERKSGMKLRELADIYNVSFQRIQQLTRHIPCSQVKYIPRKIQYSNDVANAYLACFSLTKVARKFNITVSTVVKLLKFYNIPIKRNKPAFLTIKQQNAVTLYESGISTTNVGKKYGVSWIAIRRWVLKANGKLRPKGFQKGKKHFTYRMKHEN